MNIESKIAGVLHPVDYDPDFHESDPISIPYFGNEKVKVIFIEAKHAPYLLKADHVLEAFLKLGNSDRLKNSEMVKAYYDLVLEFDDSEIPPVKTPEDIWNFVHPFEIIIHWEENGEFYVIASCGCDWEEEHGLQLVFKDGKTLTKASGHDGHYTD